jgi:hypothetical protein
MAVTPPASASSNCGSCGQIECSAHTSAVFGLVISLPSAVAWMPAPVDAEMRMRVDDAGRDPLALRIDLDGIRRRVHIRADGRNLAVLKQDRPVLDRRSGRRQDRGVADDVGAPATARRCVPGWHDASRRRHTLNSTPRADFFVASATASMYFWSCAR